MAFANRMGTLGLQRWGEGPGVKAWTAKGLRTVAREYREGRCWWGIRAEAWSVGDTGNARVCDPHFKAWNSGPHKADLGTPGLRDWPQLCEDYWGRGLCPFVGSEGLEGSSLECQAEKDPVRGSHRKKAVDCSEWKC